LALADAANGDDVEPKTARFVDEGGEEGSPSTGANGEEVPEETGVHVANRIDDVAFFDAKRFSPLTEAKGELVDAYAMNPL
jgi:hypothetical protein